MAALARYDNTWITFIPLITALSICISWSISLAHLLVPFVHRLSLSDEIPVMSLLGRGVEDYPWPVEQAQVQLIGEDLTITFDAEEVDEPDRNSPLTTEGEEKGDLITYDLV
jgi:hypothetical protein